MLWALNFAPQKYIQLCLAEVWGFLWNFIIIFTGFDLTCQILFFFFPSPPRRACSGTKGESWLEQADCEQFRSCQERGRAAGWLWQSTRGSCPQLACVAITVEMKAQQVSKEFSCGSWWTYKLGPQYNLISWNVKWLVLAACSIGVGVFFMDTLYSHFLQKNSYQCLMIA